MSALYSITRHLLFLGLTQYHPDCVGGSLNHLYLLITAAFCSAKYASMERRRTPLRSPHAINSLTVTDPAPGRKSSMSHSGDSKCVASSFGVVTPILSTILRDLVDNCSSNLISVPFCLAWTILCSDLATPRNRLPVRAVNPPRLQRRDGSQHVGGCIG